MTPKSTIAVTCLIAIAALGYYFSSSINPARSDVENSDTRTAGPPGQITNTVPETPQHEIYKAQADTLDPATESVNPVTGEFTEMEKVEGIWVKVNRNCTVKIERYRIAEDGTQTPVYSCKPDKPLPLDIYNTYSIEELKALAYHDSHAAHKLSVRLRNTDFQLATDYALRATALSGDGKYFGMMTTIMPGPATVNDTINPKYIAQGYVISGVAKAYIEGDKSHARWTRDILNHEGDGINIEALDERIVSLLQKIDSIRQEVGLN